MHIMSSPSAALSSQHCSSSSLPLVQAYRNPKHATLPGPVPLVAWAWSRMSQTSRCSSSESSNVTSDHSSSSSSGRSRMLLQGCWIHSAVLGRSLRPGACINSVTHCLALQQHVLRHMPAAAQGLMGHFTRQLLVLVAAVFRLPVPLCAKGHKTMHSTQQHTWLQPTHTGPVVS